MKPLIIHDQANAELREAMDWYDDRRFGLGWDLNIEVQAVFDRIGDRPRAGSRWPDSEIRWLKTRRFPYVVYYRELDTAIWVLAVAHERREPGYWTDRSSEEQE